MILTSNGGAFEERERQMISRPAGVFQSLPTCDSQAPKNLSSCASAAIPSASRYQRSLPSYWRAKLVHNFAASGELLWRRAMAHSRRTWGEASFDSILI